MRGMYSSLCDQYTLSANAIQDLKGDVDKSEFEELVQGLLKANYGMDWTLWWEIVEWNVRNRGDEERMSVKEEREIVLDIVEMWLVREEIEVLIQLRNRIMAFQEYLKEGMEQ